MARPKTKADPVTIRLSLAAYAEAERRAGRQGVSVREWMTQAIETAMLRGALKQQGRGEVETRFKQ